MSQPQLVTATAFHSHSLSYSQPVLATACQSFNKKLDYGLKNILFHTFIFKLQFFFGSPKLARCIENIFVLGYGYFQQVKAYAEGRTKNVHVCYLKVVRVFCHGSESQLQRSPVCFTSVLHVLNFLSALHVFPALCLMSSYPSCPP